MEEPENIKSEVALERLVIAFLFATYVFVFLKIMFF